MNKPPDPEEEFIAPYNGYVARKVARDLYRAMHPVGMHTNGPTYVRVEASHLMQLLRPFSAGRTREAMTDKPRYVLVTDEEFQRMLTALDSPPLVKSGEAIYAKAEDMRVWLAGHPNAQE